MVAMTSQVGQQYPYLIANPVALVANTQIQTTFTSASVPDAFVCDRLIQRLDVVLTPAAPAALTVADESEVADLFNAIIATNQVSSTVYPRLLNAVSGYKSLNLMRGLSGQWAALAYGYPQPGVTYPSAASHTFQIELPIDFGLTRRENFRRLFSPSWQALKIGGVWQLTAGSLSVTLGGTAFTITATVSYFMEGEASANFRDAAVLELISETQPGQNNTNLQRGLYIFNAVNQTPSSVVTSDGVQMSIDNALIYTFLSFKAPERAKAFINDVASVANSGIANAYNDFPVIPLLWTVDDADPEGLTIAQSSIGANFQSGYSATPDLLSARFLPLDAGSALLPGRATVDPNPRRMSLNYIAGRVPALMPFLPRIYV